jgi:hypothetical protein
MKRTPVHAAPTLRQRATVVPKGRDRGLLSIPDRYCACYYDMPHQQGCYFHAVHLAQSRKGPAFVGLIEDTR